ncbi:toll/interleukin-1 receptor domain-containing protein [Streptococcus zalophi]|uniref:Toll/interleukin-1 receptor domain-containing protein n=1 Tax=Streptococcus zalophi TaxID=640031 RepID=A0A934UE11_9STRE|nr:toll/interleukin-1 receptor domain-containing protein [Streptococcus zalophi]MBJ8350238.1 toll/interleukin-1 receptor domain-containing protein [Streptococcus zalophi]
MTKVFLSHSSKNKELVNTIYSKLKSIVGVESVIMDSFNFEEGRNTKEEIIYNLSKSDLFVIFLSEEALKSQWVKEELSIAGKKILENNRYQICPIIIDEKIKYDNEMIPNWLKENYNIQLVKSNKKIVNIITERMTEINRMKHSNIKNRQDLFVGRNAFLKQIEQRLDDFNQPKPIALIASGLEGVGRRTLLKRSLVKSDIVKSSYPFSEIVTERNDSIEDFILKIYDLGFFDDETKFFELSKLNNLSIDNKQIILIDLISSLQDKKVFIVVNDHGCIINHRGELAEWFKNALLSEKVRNQLLMLVSSKFRYFNRESMDMSEIYALNIPELEIKERQGLLYRYSEKVFEQELEKDKLNFISDLLTGLPEQIFYAIDKLKNIGWLRFYRNTESIVNFNNQKAEILLSDLREDDEKMKFLALLCQFDSIGEDYILKIVSNGGEETEKYQGMIESFLLQGICEPVGTLQEYIRVNDSIKDFIIRSDYKYDENHKKLLLEYVKQFIKSLDENEDYNIPELLFSLKHSLLNNIEINDKYIFPSIYLKTMNDLYYSGKYQEVINFADKALERKSNYDDKMIFEIRYLLCSALAKQSSLLSKQKNVVANQSKDRFRREVQFINGPDHDFLFGFFYRQIGQYDKALTRLDRSLIERKNFSKAKREKVQVLIAMQDYNSALELAKSNYENFKNNPYHIQAYFTCLIKSDTPNKNDILKQLINTMKIINNKVSDEMALRLEAQYNAFIEGDYLSAIENIDRAILANPDIQYARFLKFDIVERFNKIDEMKEILDYFSDPELQSKHHNNYVCMKSIVISHEKGAREAKRFFHENIKNYTEEAKERFIGRLERINTNENLK